MTKKTFETSKIPMANKGPMYIYATEMIKEYYSLFNLKNKNILTICGSGDQVLNALFLGAKKVTGFDLNIYSKYILNLKVSAILSLQLKEFIKFFGDKKINVGFDYEIYKKIRKNLNNETRHFFDDLYEKFDFNGDKLANSDYFRKRASVQKRSVKEFNYYLEDEKSYLKIRKTLKIRKFDFVLGSVLDISFLIKNGKYDLINLSNVQNYVCLNLSEEKTIKCFYKNILLPLSNLLSNKGVIFYYTSDEKTSYPNPARKTPPTLTKTKNIKLFSKFDEFKVSQKAFKSFFNKSNKDKIVIFQKNY